MLPPCFTLADSVFPLVRQRAARLMADEGLTQSEIGRRLGVSQAMVSKYLKGEALEPEAQTAWIVEEMAQQVSAALDSVVAGTPEPGQANPWCRTFAQTLGPADEARRAVVAETAEVVLRLEGAPIAPLVPAVNVNIAGALQDAAGREDVAAFPGRLALVRGRLRAHGPPEFGASRHLTGVLLRAREEDPSLRFVLNLRGDAAVERALRRAGEAVAEGDASQRDDAGVPLFRLDSARAMRDPGGFGIEPALYLLDTTGAGLAERVRRLAEATR